MGSSTNQRARGGEEEVRRVWGNMQIKGADMHSTSAINLVGP